MSKRVVRHVIDLQNPPVLTEVQKAELNALTERPDSDINFSDIPPLTDDFWKNAQPNPFFKPKKASTTVRLDADVLAWLRGQGKGYQTRMNAILRREMLASLKKTG